MVAQKPTREEVTLETAELAALEGQGHRLGPRELGALAKRLARATDATEAARLRERLTRGVYGIGGEGDLVKTFPTPDQSRRGVQVK